MGGGGRKLISGVWEYGDKLVTQIYCFVSNGCEVELVTLEEKQFM
jgi:hypothetical protein